MTYTTVREAPAAKPLLRGPDDSHPDVGDHSPRPEPVLDVDNIQGNILGGFMKDYQTLLFLKIVDVYDFKSWLKTLVPFIATSAEVLAFNRLFKAIRTRRGDTRTVQATWLNIAFSFSALKKLTDSAEAFTDEAFKAGLAARSESLGDPTGQNDEGNPQNWVVGGPDNEADIVLLIASDDRNDLFEEVSRVEDSIYAFRIKDKPAHSGVQIIYKQQGANLPGSLAGHEHFGFLDGVSQPGVRGRISKVPFSVLTPRQNPDKRDQPPEFDESGKLLKQGIPAQGKPGQDLLWPGEFVFGYPKQKPTDNENWDGPNPDPGPNSIGGPEWAKDGSFLVFRRLRQDVFGFHTFLRETSKDFGGTPGLLGAKLVGRWSSGAPILRAQTEDNAALADSDCANNNFEFQGDSSQETPPDKIGDTQCESKKLFPPSPGDKIGAICPFAAHIRKAYPRDDESDDTSDAPDISGCNSRSRLKESDTQTHRLLRRGIPYGEVSRSSPNAPFQDSVDRGLLFLAHQTSIVNQFEFVTKCWVNNPDFKEPFDEKAKKGAGYDPILGQNNNPGENRERKFIVEGADGTPHVLSTQQDWVIPTGGGYFFAPSICALKMLSED